MTKAIELTSLLGSRICHDLISPLGAIGNGVELLAMTGMSKGPEISLIEESVENANARIRFFRVAFGAASPGQTIARSEVQEVLAGLTRGGRVQIAWQVDGETPRREVKLAFLCLQCLEAAMPWGGRIIIAREGPAWLLSAEASKLRDLDGAWMAFDSGEAPGSLAAAEIEFLLAPVWAAEAGFALERAAEPNRITIRFAPV